jgi:Na+/phosphate symporter
MKQTQQQLIQEIKILRLAIGTAEKMIQNYMSYYEVNPAKYADKIVKKYEQINKFEALIGHIRVKLLKIKFEK